MGCIQWSSILFCFYVNVFGDNERMSTTVRTQHSYVFGFRCGVYGNWLLYGIALFFMPLCSLCTRENQVQCVLKIGSHRRVHVCVHLYEIYTWHSIHIQMWERVCVCVLSRIHLYTYMQNTHSCCSNKNTTVKQSKMAV